MTRAHVAGAVMAGLGAFLALDLSASRPLNPYTSPMAVALGSGQAATGAHCAAPPPPDR